MKAATSVQNWSQSHLSNWNDKDFMLFDNVKERSIYVLLLQIKDSAWLQYFECLVSEKSAYLIFIVLFFNVTNPDYKQSLKIKKYNDSIL